MKTKKKMMSLLLAVCMVLTLMPTTALAEETESARSSKTVITTVHELQQFAKAVDNGEYDDKTDAVVSLEADLDLTGVAWKPIGSVFDGDGNLLHYFSGKFYGNFRFDDSRQAGCVQFRVCLFWNSCGRCRKQQNF